MASGPGDTPNIASGPIAVSVLVQHTFCTAYSRLWTHRRLRRQDYRTLVMELGPPGIPMVNVKPPANS